MSEVCSKSSEKRFALTSSLPSLLSLLPSLSSLPSYSLLFLQLSCCFFIAVAVVSVIVIIVSIIVIVVVITVVVVVSHINIVVVSHVNIVVVVVDVAIWVLIFNLRMGNWLYGNPQTTLSPKSVNYTSRFCLEKRSK